MASCRLLDTALTSKDILEFSFRLINEKLYLPDVIRDVKRVMEVATDTFNKSCQPFALVNSKNELGGAFFLSDIVPGHEAVFYLWCWDGRCVTATTLPFIREYIDANAEEYGLGRVTARTPCRKLCHLLNHLGLREEGRFSKGYRHGGKSVNLYQLRKLYAR